MSEPKPKSKRLALVIGNGAYVNATKLENPRNDAEAISSVLEKLGFDVLPCFDLERDPFEDQLGNFVEQITGADAALIFYAGHGLQVKGQNYLIPVDAEIRQEVHLRRRTFSLDEILDMVVGRARTSLVFLDACRDNPFSRSLLSGMSPQEKGRYLVRSGLAEIKASRGSFIAFATAPDNVASDGKGNNSPFTTALLAHVETPNISVSDMMIEVRKQVLKETEGKQEPWDQSSLRERFCFRPLGRIPKPKPEKAAAIANPVSFAASASGSADRLSLAAAEWDRIRDTADIERFLRFEKHFAGTYYADEAASRRKELEADAQRRREAEKEKLVAEEKRYRAEGRVKVRVGAIGQEETRWIKAGGGRDAAETFQDIPEGPEMLVVPVGSFLMGSPDGEGDKSEHPQHSVAIKNPFAVSISPITHGEFATFIGATNHTMPDMPMWSDPVFMQKDDHPVATVNWNDAQAYVKWLRDQCGGKAYQLLSEAEWEYCCRAGSTGDTITADQANLETGNTTPVSKFPPNPWGLRDMHGHVAEWCEDNWHRDYNSAPGDGSAWLGGNSTFRVFRRASRSGFDSQYPRPAVRNRTRPGVRNCNIGFRVARTL